MEALAICGATGTVAACTPPKHPSPTTTTPTTTVVGNAGDPAAFLLASRLSFGPSPELLALAEGGVDAYLADQLDPAAAEAPAMADLFAAIDARGEDIASTPPSDGGSQNRRRAAVETTALRTTAGAAWSSRQLHALLVDFWSDHLHVSIGQQPELFFVPYYDAEVIRPHAMGSFTDMLLASARHAAMLTYLDQASSRADRDNVPNENYARELMELHTVGVDGGYDETDVLKAAHVLSGFSLVRKSREYTYRQAWHDLGPAATGDVLGYRPSGAGERDGEDFLAHLAHLPATANHVCHRLAVRLVGDSVSPTDPVVADAAAAFTADDTSIASAVRSIVDSPAFADSTPIPRRPIDLVAAMLRMGSTPVTESQLDDLLNPLGRTVRVLGQSPWAWPAPNGYPLPGRAWISPGAMVGRWNAALTAGAGFQTLDPLPGTSTEDGADRTSVATALLGRAPSPELATALGNDLGAQPGSQAESIGVRTLVFASPDFQER